MDGEGSIKYYGRRITAEDLPECTCKNKVQFPDKGSASRCIATMVRCFKNMGWVLLNKENVVAIDWDHQIWEKAQSRFSSELIQKLELQEKYKDIKKNHFEKFFNAVKNFMRYWCPQDHKNKSLKWAVIWHNLITPYARTDPKLFVGIEKNWSKEIE